jgi:hypothetical protein
VVAMKNGVFWDVIPCGSCKNQRFGGTWRLHHRDDSCHPDDGGPKSLRNSFITRATRRNIPEDVIVLVPLWF